MQEYAMGHRFDVSSNKAVEGRLSRLETLVESNREGIQELKQSIKEMHLSSLESQKLLVASVENLKNTIDDLLRIESSIETVRLKTERNNADLEKRLSKLEVLQAKVSGGLIVFTCLLNLPWEWLVALFRTPHD